MPQTAEIIAKHLHAQIELADVRLDLARATVGVERVREYCAQVEEAIAMVDEYLHTGKVGANDQAEIRDKLARLKKRLAEVSVTPESA